MLLHTTSKSLSNYPVIHSKPFFLLVFPLMTFIKSLCETTSCTPKPGFSILWVCASWSKLCGRTIIDPFFWSHLFPAMQHNEAAVLASFTATAAYCQKLSIILNIGAACICSAAFIWLSEDLTWVTIKMLLFYLLLLTLVAWNYHKKKVLFSSPTPFKSKNFQLSLKCPFLFDFSVARCYIYKQP